MEYVHLLFGYSKLTFDCGSYTTDFGVAGTNNVYYTQKQFG